MVTYNENISKPTITSLGREKGKRKSKEAHSQLSKQRCPTELSVGMETMFRICTI